MGGAARCTWKSPPEYAGGPGKPWRCDSGEASEELVVWHTSGTPAPAVRLKSLREDAEASPAGLPTSIGTGSRSLAVEPPAHEGPKSGNGSSWSGDITGQAHALLQELVTLRRRYARTPTCRSEQVERAQAARRIIDVLSRLDCLGVPSDEALSREDPSTLLLLLRSRSFRHRDFANPRAETCWLSCLFQSLWHSVVFHAAFELYLTPAKYTPRPGDRLLMALQRTWAQYDQEAARSSSFSPPPRLVPPKDLAEAFGEGYGDMSEALASLQQELSESSHPAAAAVAELLSLIPLSTLEETMPTPDMAWKQAKEWKLTATPILAVDLSLPDVPQATLRRLARYWIPPSARNEGAAAAQHHASDFGPTHRLVALVCYLWTSRHYVAFCRRQRVPDRCLFFNDMPSLTKEAPRELAWAEVPEACSRYSLTPRLALYESIGAAEEVIQKRRLKHLASPSSKATDSDDEDAGTGAAAGAAADGRYGDKGGVNSPGAPGGGCAGVASGAAGAASSAAGAFAGAAAGAWRTAALRIRRRSVRDLPCPQQ